MGHQMKRESSESSSRLIFKQEQLADEPLPTDFLDYASFFKGIPPIPIVWTLHDMNQFTGGCHYTSGCTHFRDRCGRCPQLGSNSPNDSARTWKRKRQIFNNLDPRRIQIVTPSAWLAKEVQSSSLLGQFPVSVIPNGLDTDTFSPLDKNLARSAFGLPVDSKVVLFASESTSNQRKGFKFLAEAISKLDDIHRIHEFLYF